MELFNVMIPAAPFVMVFLFVMLIWNIKIKSKERYFIKEQKRQIQEEKDKWKQIYAEREKEKEKYFYLYEQCLGYLKEAEKKDEEWKEYYYSENRIIPVDDPHLSKLTEEAYALEEKAVSTNEEYFALTGRTIEQDFRRINGEANTEFNLLWDKLKEPHSLYWRRIFELTNSYD